MKKLNKIRDFVDLALISSGNEITNVSEKLVQTVNSGKKSKSKKVMSAALMCVLSIMSVTCPAYASGKGADADVADKVAGAVDSFIGIIGIIFQALGVILGVYSMGQLILAFKNDDADSKVRAGTLLVVALIMLFFPIIVNQLDLTSYITG